MAVRANWALDQSTSDKSAVSIIGYRGISYLFKYVFTSLFIVIIVLLEEIMEEENPQNCKYYKKLDNYYNPHFLSPPRHIFKTIIVETDDFPSKV
jgi:hypothetical protein